MIFSTEHILSLLPSCGGCYKPRLDMVLDIESSDGFRCSDCSSSSSKIEIPWFCHLRKNIHPLLNDLPYKLNQEVLLYDSIPGIIMDYHKNHLSYEIHHPPSDKPLLVSFFTSTAHMIPHSLELWKALLEILPPCPVCKKNRLDMILDSESEECICCLACSHTDTPLPSILPWFKALLHRMESFKDLLPWKIHQKIDVYLDQDFGWTEGTIMDVDISTLCYNIQIPHWHLQSQDATMTTLISYPLFKHSYYIAPSRTYCRNDWKDSIEYFTHLECLSCEEHGYGHECDPKECAIRSRWKLLKVVFYCPLRKSILVLTSSPFHMAHVEWISLDSRRIRYVWDWE